MEILDLLSREGVKYGFSFLVMSGLSSNPDLAIPFTTELILLARNEDREMFTVVMICADYEIFHEQDAYVRFMPPDETNWHVDVIFLDQKDFAENRARTVEVSFGERKVRVVKMNPGEMIEWCESCLPIWNAMPGAEEKRLREKCPVEFVL